MKTAKVAIKQTVNYTPLKYVYTKPNPSKDLSGLLDICKGKNVVEIVASLVGINVSNKNESTVFGELINGFCDTMKKTLSCSLFRDEETSVCYERQLTLAEKANASPKMLNTKSLVDLNSYIIDVAKSFNAATNKDEQQAVMTAFYKRVLPCIEPYASVMKPDSIYRKVYGSAKSTVGNVEYVHRSKYASVTEEFVAKNISYGDMCLSIPHPLFRIDTSVYEDKQSAVGIGNALYFHLRKFVYNKYKFDNDIDIANVVDLFRKQHAPDIVCIIIHEFLVYADAAVYALYKYITEQDSDCLMALMRTIATNAMLRSADSKNYVTSHIKLFNEITSYIALVRQNDLVKDKYTNEIDKFLDLIEEMKREFLSNIKLQNPYDKVDFQLARLALCNVDYPSCKNTHMALDKLLNSQ